jgi:hypothetical protein
MTFSASPGWASHHVPTPAGHRVGRPARLTLRSLLVAALAVGALVLPSTGASARSSDWTLWQPPTGVVVACGSTPVTLDWPYNKEYVRELPLTPGATDVQQFTGSLTVRYSTADKTVTYNIGGPGIVTTYTNGDQLVHSEGHYNFALTPEQAAQLGVPQIFNTVGLLEFVIHQDGTMTPIRIPSNVTNVCADLGL